MEVSLHRVSRTNWRQVIELDVGPDQHNLISPNVRSLAEAYVHGAAYPFAIHAGSCSDPQPQEPMVGFTMYEVTDSGIGFIMKLMIDHRYQGRGYGRAAMVELMRRLKLHPQVQKIATSHRVENTAASQLYRSLGFVGWDVSHWKVKKEGEVYLILDEGGEAD